MECNCSSGVTITRRMSKEERVNCNTTARAAGSNAFDISQRISSARTAASAIVVENVMVESRRVVGHLPSHDRDG